jgi:carbon monoxide dehydrogenase subunit G
MHFDGTFEVKAPREKLYNLLMDPNQVSSCMPGFKGIEITSPEDYTIVLKVGVAFIKTEVKMHMLVKEAQSPSHAKLVGSGVSSSGNLDMEVTADLAEENGQTTMKWAAEANVSGKLASMGQRMITGQAEKIIKNMFDCLKTKVA